jgi:tetratricopeptide (TPR) repeat protein
MKLATRTLLLLVLSAGSVAAQGRVGTGSPGQQAFDEGVKALNADDFPQAERKFREAISLDNSLVDAYWKLAAVLYRDKKYSDAVSLLRRCPDKNNVEVREQLGLSLYNTAKPPPEEAIKLLEDVAAARPDKYLAQLQIGKHFKTSDPKKAAAALEQYLKHRPSEAAGLDEPTRQLLGTAYIYGKDWDSAAKTFEQLLRSKPNDVTNRLMLGTALVGKGECSRAIPLYEKLLPEANKQPSIFYNLGSCYHKVGRFADAEREANLYIKAKSNDAKGYTLLGDANYDQRRYDKALGAYQTARSFDKASNEILRKIGRTDLRLGNIDAAVAELEQAVSPQSEDIDLLCDLTDAYNKKKLKDKVASVAGRLSKFDSDAKAQFCAGNAWEGAGDEEKAIAAFRQVLTIDPNRGSAKTELARLYNQRAGGFLAKNDLARALANLKDASALLPDDLMTNRNLGLVYTLSKKYADAEVVLNRALKKLGRPDLVLNRLLGRAMLGEGKKQAARAEYEKAAQIALRTRGTDLADVYAELGPLYAESGSLDQAVTVLEQAVKEAGSAPVAAVAQRNLAVAYLQRGVERLADPKQADGALDDITKASQAKGALNPKELVDAACYEGVAALKAQRVPQAVEAFRRAATGGGCKLKPPHDKLGTSFLLAYAGYRDASSPKTREEAAKLFGQLVPKASGATADTLKALQRSTYELLAFDYFTRSDEKRAEQSLRLAARVVGKADRRELDHNQAVLDLALGRTAQAQRTFDALNGRPPESLVNQGIMKDRAGDSRGALALYRRAWERGVRSARLREWIDVKERLFGGGQ